MARRLGMLLGAMALLLGLDQASKAWVRADIPLHHSSVLVPELLELTHVENRGVSFSFLGDLADSVRVPLLVCVSLVAVALLAYYWLRHRRELHPFAQAAFVLILPGALGNLLDRLRSGTVTDFLHFRFYETSFFVNNLADILISLGVVAYLLGALLERQRRAAPPGGADFSP
jgi:signal peptidase II